MEGLRGGSLEPKARALRGRKLEVIGKRLQVLLDLKKQTPLEKNMVTKSPINLSKRILDRNDRRKFRS